jgi:predicted dehydrogenase
MNRRVFSTAALATATLASAQTSPARKTANDRVIAGLIGCGGRGRYVANEMRKAPNVEFGAVCDVYEANAARAREWAGPNAKQYSDFRRLLEDKDIDVVLIATPDHWHAIPTILACQAGKDVYIEKPLAHNINEGKAMVAAARQYNRIVQAGMQHRSAPHYAEVAKLVQSGAIGEVRFVRVWNYLNLFPNGIGKEPDSPPPAGLDWDMWLGPAPRVPFNRKRFLATYRWFREYAGGFITDFGTHRFDTVHQVMGSDAPTAVSASGGRYALRDAGNVPDFMQVTWEYPGWVLSYECSLLNGHGLGGRTEGMRYYNMRGDLDRPHGEAYYGTQGTIFADRIGYEIYPEKDAKIERKWMNTKDATGLHAANFIENVRERRTPVADVATGHRSTIIPLLGNIALDTGRKLRWDAKKENFIADREASALLGRKARKPWDLV